MLDSIDSKDNVYIKKPKTLKSLKTNWRTILNDRLINSYSYTRQTLDVDNIFPYIKHADSDIDSSQSGGSSGETSDDEQDDDIDNGN